MVSSAGSGGLAPMAKDYRNFNVRLFERRVTAGLEECKVLVTDSPVGEDHIRNASAVTFPSDFRQRLSSLESRALSIKEVIGLGVDIASILFPKAVREKLLQCLPRDDRDPPLRIRVQCEELELDLIPWEYAYLPRDQFAQRNVTGFLVLNSDTSLVRYKLMNRPRRPLQTLGGRSLRLFAAFSSPTGELKLDLSKEEENMRRILEKVETIQKPVRFVDHLTVRAFNDALAEVEPDIVHYAGHGAFRPPPANPTAPATGHLLFEEDDGSACYYQSELLALDLQDKNVRLVVLSACESALGAGQNAWAAVAPVLVTAGIPAVVGMQYSVFDQSAIAFGERFYSSLAQGKTIDEAVAEGRKAMLRARPDGRDFGVPVLYLRCNEPSDAVLFPLSPKVLVSAPTPVDDRAERDLDSVLHRIAQLGDYKRLHDALHNTRDGGLDVMLAKIDSFPANARTVAEFRAYLAKFKAQLTAVQQVFERDLCERTLVTALRDGFAATLAEVEAAVSAKDAQGSQSAMTNLESHIVFYSSIVNQNLVAAAANLDLEPLLHVLRATVGGAPAAATTLPELDELSSLSDTLKSKVGLHSRYQLMDNALSILKSQPDADLIKNWKNHKSRILLLQPMGSGDASKDFVQIIGEAVDRGDKDAVLGAFVEFCSAVQTDFSSVDTDLLRLCDEVKDKTAKSLVSVRRVH